MLLKTSDGDVFEDNISLNQDLTFQKTTEHFSARELRFSSRNFISIGIANSDGIFTNLGLLLSDQFPYSIKTAVFRGNDQSVFQDRKEFTGALLAQLEECYTYLDLNNPTAAEFNGLYRNDKPAYPKDALREALLNLIVHRDYSFSADSFISIYNNRIEFTSIGGLMPGIHKDDILLGISVCRNKRLADVFYRLKLIEAYGTGLLKIQSAYESYSVKPDILLGTNTFKLILPKLET